MTSKPHPADHAHELLLPLHEEIRESCRVDAIAALKSYLSGFAKLIDSQMQFSVIGARPARIESHPLLGWRVVDIVFDNSAPLSFIKKISNFEATDRFMHGDLPIRRLIENSNAWAYSFQQEFPGARGRGYFSVHMLSAMGYGDRIAAAQPISETASIYFGFDRVKGQPHYTRDEVALAAQSVRTLPELGVAVADAYGID